MHEDFWFWQHLEHADFGYTREESRKSGQDEEKRKKQGNNSEGVVLWDIFGCNWGVSFECI